MLPVSVLHRGAACGAVGNGNVCWVQEEADSRTTVLMVVGAGRGPLVAASLRASVRAKRKLRCTGRMCLAGCGPGMWFAGLLVAAQLHLSAVRCVGHFGPVQSP